MVTPPDIQAQILRCYHAEKWRIGTIAAQLHVHHAVVARARRRRAAPARPAAAVIEGGCELPFIRQTLEKFPTLTASRLYAMARERGYRGGPDHFRHLVACHRPRRPARAYLRLRSLPGEQAQVDWAHFGHLEIGRARRPLMAFVTAPSHSGRFSCASSSMPGWRTSCGGTLQPSRHFRVPRVLLYDNLKSAALERRGDAIRFDPTLPGFAGHYRYELPPVTVGAATKRAASSGQ